MSASAHEHVALLSENHLARGLEARPRGIIGPNAVIQLAGVLHDRLGPVAAFDVFERAGIEHYLALPPEHMVDEREVAALYAALHEALGIASAGRLSWEAGLRTGDYLLANRVPWPVTTALSWLPRTMAARFLASAIARHAWTFVGGGRFGIRPGSPLALEVCGSPLCRLLRAHSPVCSYFAGTFERLFGAVSGGRASVRETACEAAGASGCLFELTFGAGASGRIFRRD